MYIHMCKGGRCGLSSRGPPRTIPRLAGVAGGAAPEAVGQVGEARACAVASDPVVACPAAVAAVAGAPGARHGAQGAGVAGLAQLALLPAPVAQRVGVEAAADPGGDVTLPMATAVCHTQGFVFGLLVCIYGGFAGWGDGWV